MSILSKIKYWYLGGPQPTRERISETAETIRLPNTFDPSASARVAQYIVKHLPGITAALFAAAVALFIYFDGKSDDKISNPKSHSEKTSSIEPIVVVHTSNPAFKRDAAKARRPLTLR